MHQIRIRTEVVYPNGGPAYDKYDALLAWSKDHLFEQFTTEQLVEVSGFSYPTTLKFLQESPTFRKVKKGLWEVRDAEADKKAEKNL